MVGDKLFVKMKRMQLEKRKVKNLKNINYICKNEKHKSQRNKKRIKQKRERKR